MKKLFMVFSLLSVLVLSFTTVFAQEAIDTVNQDIEIMADLEETDSIGARFTYIQMASNGLSISRSGEANVYAKVIARSPIDNVQVSSSLQQYKNSKWVELQSWTVKSNDSIGILDKLYDVDKGYEYRVVSTFKVYEGKTQRESVSDTYTTSH